MDVHTATQLEVKVTKLVRAVMRGEDLVARQWLKDARKERIDISALPPPPNAFTPNERATYASLVELFAEREGQSPPSWTKTIGPADAPIYLDSDAARSARLRSTLERNAPEPLRRRHIYAVRDYLDVI